MKVFLDANILFSSSNPQSATRFLLDIILSNHGVKIVSSTMLAGELL